MKRIAFAGGLLFCLMALLSSRGAGQDSPAEDPRVRVMVDRGLAFLAKTQEPSGAWRCLIYKKGSESESKLDENVGVTAIACIAFMADGNLPDRGPYAQTVAKGLEFVMSCVQESGYISANQTRMYEHGFATLFLAEVYGMTKRKDVRPVLQKAVDLIVRCQNDKGGWRYQPAPVVGDLSVTVTIVQALRASRNVGIVVPKETIEKAYKYVTACMLSQGGFTYQQAGEGDIGTSYSLTAAGLVCLYGLGYYDDKNRKEYDKHFGILNVYLTGRNPPGVALRPSAALNPRGGHFFYGNYYAAQAYYQRGGEDWQRYYPRMVSILEQAQDKASGKWMADVHPSYDTAMACIILLVPKEYLPILQR